MPKANREKICYLCEEVGSERLSFMVCAQCARHFCSHHGDPQIDECINCLEDGEET